MSYITVGNAYYNPPKPYDGPDFASRVPGWGPLARAAGPSRWGVGALPVSSRLKASAALKTSAIPLKTIASTKAPGTATSETPGETKGWPWWVWIAVPMVLGGATLAAYDMGWLGD